MQFWHELFHKRQKLIVSVLQAWHRLLVKFLHLVRLIVDHLQHDTKSICLVDIHKENGNHISHALDVPNFRLYDTQALKDWKKVFLSVHKPFLKVDMVGQSSGDILVDIVERLFVSFLIHEVYHEFLNILLLLNHWLRLFRSWVLLCQKAPGVSSEAIRNSFSTSAFKLWMDLEWVMI